MISVLIPAYNEENTIAATIRAVWEVKMVRQVVVVDDGSADATAVRAAEAGATVIKLSSNKGKGNALNVGIPHLKEPIIALLDADLGESSGQLEVLARPVVEGVADMTIAAFPRVRKGGGFGLVKGLARSGIYLLTGLWLQAPLSGQRVLRREVLAAVFPFAEGYGVEVAMTVRAARAGFRILEVPTTMSHRVTGKDWAGFKHRGKQFWHVLLTLLKVVSER